MESWEWDSVRCIPTGCGCQWRWLQWGMAECGGIRRDRVCYNYCWSHDHHMHHSGKSESWNHRYIWCNSRSSMFWCWFHPSKWSSIWRIHLLKPSYSRSHWSYPSPGVYSWRKFHHHYGNRFLRRLLTIIREGINVDTFISYCILSCFSKGHFLVYS